MRLGTLTAGIVLSLVTTLPAASQVPAVTATSTVIEGGEHTFTEPLVVAPGATLTIRDAKVFLDAPRHCPTGGTVAFCRPHLFVMPGATLVAERVTFDTHRSVDIEDPSTGYMVYSYGGRLLISDSTILRANVVGGEAPGHARSVVRDSTFSHGIQAISFTRGMDALIEGNTIAAHRFGIDVRDSSAVIRANTVSVLGYGIDVQSTQVGDKALPTRALVEDNVVTGSLGGFFTLNGFSSTVRGNTFEGNKWGAILGVNGGDAIVARERIVFERNRLAGNENALRSYVSVSHGQSEPTDYIVPIRGNSIVGTTCRAVQVTSSTNPNVRLTLDARENWWGSPEGPLTNGDECPAVTGAALVEPWLQAPPE
ncbi:MAG TPA: right-handed parallel beta-helix repeat-containing protein [Actinomycetota bacterium]|nr:right-handed parallel beta-helix repeat-containing protein [Actinomycetota bacterium]